MGTCNSHDCGGVQAAGLSNKDLCYVRYEGDAPGVLPYFIAVDTNSQDVILAIRGKRSRAENE